MKLGGTSCISHEISQNSLGDTTWFLHEDHRNKFKGNAERYAVYRVKDRVRKRESKKKADWQLIQIFSLMNKNGQHLHCVS